MLAMETILEGAGWFCVRDVTQHRFRCSRGHPIHLAWSHSKERAPLIIFHHRC